MINYCCDRCGRIIGHRDRYDSIVPETVFYCGSKNGEVVSRFMLCGECTELLNTWVKGERDADRDVH